MSLEIGVDCVWMKSRHVNFCLKSGCFLKMFAPSSFWAVEARKSGRTQFLADSTRTAIKDYDSSRKKAEGLMSQTYLETPTNIANIIKYSVISICI